MKKEIKPICQQSAEFYYDFLAEPQTVPPAVREHIEQCPRCRDEIQRLQDVLQSPPPEARPVRQDVLRCQIPLFDKWVDCTQAKPFLPLLTIPAFVPSVPTPIAAHLAHCSHCRQDKAALERLSLTAEQAIAAARVLCGDAKPNEQFSGTCADVLETILRRPASDVLTKLSRNQTDGTFQIAVAEQPASTPQSRPSPSASHRKWLRPAAAAAVLLIAALFLWQVKPACGLDISEVYQALGKAVNVAIASYPLPNAPAMLIAPYALEEQRPLQEIWGSDSLAVQLFIEKEQAVLWDLTRQRKIIKSAAGLETIPITQPVKKLQPPWGLLPFRSPAELPAKYKWKQVHPSDDEDLPAHIKVYDLTWTDFSSSGQPIERRWRGYLDAKTKYPIRIEWWEKLGNEPFRRITSTTIRYPTDEEVLARIAAEGFDYRPAVQK